jgi:general secretion pathway protein E/type IV pilus assembly protein PilB
VLRILGKKAKGYTIPELGFTDAQLATIRSLMKIPHGLVLVTGPTGSGKTTTLNAMIREIVSDELKVITVEDPVEFLVDGVNQIQINEQISLGFETILRRVLRHDPNVIMVGEIRDGDTAEIAVRAALTGHLVLSTLHTNDAVSVIPRLTNMGAEPYLTAAVLKGAIAQRLVRKLCPSCAKRRDPTERERKIFSAYGIRKHRVREPVGCPACGGSGYLGRTVVSEIFTVDRGLEDLILENARLSALSDYLAKGGMTSMGKSGASILAEGVTTLRELEREIPIMGDSA